MAKIYLRSSGSRSHVETHRSLDKTAYPAVAISDRKTRAILFLRAASGRASIGLAAFYMYLAATEADLDAPTPIHADEVRRATLRYSALWTVALCVRSIFDDEADSATRLNAKSVVNLSDVGREQVAQYWAEKKAARALADARLAIRFVVRLLERGAVSIRGACKSHYTLIRRIALVKALADREAAHISVQHYELTTSDLAHTIAAAALMGAIVRHFDQPSDDGADYLESVDVAAHASAVAIFPEFRDVPRLFGDGFIHGTLHNLYSGRLVDGVEYLSEILLSALGWIDDATL